MYNRNIVWRLQKFENIVQVRGHLKISWKRTQNIIIIKNPTTKWVLSSDLYRHEQHDRCHRKSKKCLPLSFPSDIWWGSCGLILSFFRSVLWVSFPVSPDFIGPSLTMRFDSPFCNFFMDLLVFSSFFVLCQGVDSY